MFDTRGYLWIGTDEGLNRFDGEEFFVYRKEYGNANSLCGNVITDIIQDRDDELWCATRDGGICRLNLRTGNAFHPVLLNPELNAEMKFVHSIAFDGTGRMVVGTDKGVFSVIHRGLILPMCEIANWAHAMICFSTMV